MVDLSLLDDIGEFNEIKIIQVIIFDKTEYFSQMRNDFGVVEDSVSFDGLL